MPYHDEGRRNSRAANILSTSIRCRQLALATVLFITISTTAFVAAGEEKGTWTESWGDDPTSRKYYVCLKFVGCEVKTCPEGQYYDRKIKSCHVETSRQKRQTAVVGVACTESTDCRRGAYCDSTKRCKCLSTYTAINDYCWQKINPGQSGCQYSKQCSAIWPNAYCSTGQCKCGNNQPPFNTKDGLVCVNYGNCPIGGNYVKRRVPDGSGQIYQCLLDYPGSIGPAGTLLRTCQPGYNCICAESNCPAGGLAFCCPDRALTCIQSVDTGSTPSRGGGTVTRYYHNPVTGECQTFQYRGAKGNANNFQSKDQCESYCKQICPRGPQEYEFANPTPTPIRQQVKYCTGTSSSQCTNGYQCETVGSLSFCCPKAATVCSKAGANLYRIRSPLTTNYDPGTANGITTVTYPRWYYDVSDKRCKSFNYLGQDGNWNNFIDEAQCEQYCAKVLCDAGTPLKDQSGVNNLVCSSSSTCPLNYECVTGNVCCPRKQYVCSQPKQQGTCGSYVERWWYNSDTRNCEAITFSGCQGNDNNFETYTDCQTYCKDAKTAPKCPQGLGLKDSYGNYIVCGGTTSDRTTCPANYQCYYDGTTYGCCPTRAYTCAQQYDQGTSCGPEVSRWYYNAAGRSCQVFTYSGCDGNSNNFATQSDCKDYCGVGGCPNGGEPFREVNGQYRTCTAGITCPATHYCTQVTLGTTTTYNYCCPSKTYVCGLPRDQGTRCGSSSITRYFFNSVTRNCESYGYNGCDGNRNNFATLSQCLNYCNAAACPAGQTVSTDINNNRLTTCQTGLQGSCSNSYNCVYSRLLAQNICCGAPVSQDTCPTGQSAYYDAFSQTAQQCLPNVVGSCPAGFSCWFSVTQNNYYCCGTSTVQCPQGGQPYIQKGSNTAQQCTPGVTNNCPQDYNCQPTSITIGNVLSTTGYCCGSANLCGVGFSVYNQNGNAIQCEPTNPGACPQPYTCRGSPGTSNYYCCQPSINTATVTNVCASYQEIPYVIENAPVVCSSGSQATNCPTTYTCRNYRELNTFYCCQSPNGGGIGGGVASQCPPGRTALQPIRSCSPSQGVGGAQGNCPAGAICQYDSTQQRFICCGGGSILPQQPVFGNKTIQQTPQGTPPQVICPNQQPAISSSSGQPLSCAPNRPGNCPTGSSCTFVQGSNGNFCCPGQGCPRGAPYFYLNTRIPLACRGPQDSSANCPSGYRCSPSTSYPGAFQCCSAGFRRKQNDDQDNENDDQDLQYLKPVMDDVDILEETEPEEVQVSQEDIDSDGPERLILAHEFLQDCESDIQCFNLDDPDKVKCTWINRYTPKKTKCVCAEKYVLAHNACVLKCPPGMVPVNGICEVEDFRS